MILDIRGIMKSKGHFTYPSKICGETCVVPKRHCRDMMTLIGLVVLQIERSLQHIAESRVFHSVQPGMNILQLRRKQVKIPQVMRNMIQKNYTDKDKDYTLIHFIIG